MMLVLLAVDFAAQPLQYQPPKLALSPLFQSYRSKCANETKHWGEQRAE